MPRSTSDVSKLEADALAAGDSAMRRIDGDAARLRPGVAAARAGGASREWAFERAAREFSRLREALNERDEEIRRLRAGAKQHFEELSRVKAAALTEERQRSLAMDRALSSERALSDLQRQLRDNLATEMRALDTMRAAWVTATSELAENRSQLESTRSAHSHTLDELNAARGELSSAQDELETSHFHLTATRAELKAVHAEYTIVQSELGESGLAMKALGAELAWARRELESMRACAGLDVDGRVVASGIVDACQQPGGGHEQRAPGARGA
jgi:chromosome segregation ATPase